MQVWVFAVLLIYIQLSIFSQLLLFIVIPVCCAYMVIEKQAVSPLMRFKWGNQNAQSEFYSCGTLTEYGKNW